MYTCVILHGLCDLRAQEGDFMEEKDIFKTYGEAPDDTPEPAVGECGELEYKMGGIENE